MIMQGCTIKHDGQKMVIFTKQEYRHLDRPITSTGKSVLVGLADSTDAMVEEGEEEEHEQQQQQLTKSAKRRQKQQVRSSSNGGSRSGAVGGKAGEGRTGKLRSGRGTFRELQQRTMEKYVSKTTSVL